MCVYIYPKLLEEVDKKKKKSPENQKGYKTSYIKKFIWKKRKKKKESMTLMILNYIYILKK